MDVPTNARKKQPSLPENNKGESGAGTSLPPRTLQFRDRSVSPEPRSNAPGNEGTTSARTRPPIQSNLQAEATTAVSLTAIGSQSHDEGAKDDGASAIRSLPGNLRARASLSQLVTSKGSEAGDTASIRSSIPNTEMGEAENLFGDFAISERGSNTQDAIGFLQFPEFQAAELEDDFTREFDPVGEVDEDGKNEGLYQSANVFSCQLKILTDSQNYSLRNGKQNESIISFFLPRENLFGLDMAIAVWSRLTLALSKLLFPFTRVLKTV